MGVMYGCTRSRGKVRNQKAVAAGADAAAAAAASEARKGGLCDVFCGRFAVFTCVLSTSRPRDSARRPVRAEATAGEMARTRRKRLVQTTFSAACTGGRGRGGAG